jgi:hypothetical protein
VTTLVKLLLFALLLSSPAVAGVEPLPPKYPKMIFQSDIRRFGRKSISVFINRYEDRSSDDLIVLIARDIENRGIKYSEVALKVSDENGQRIIVRPMDPKVGFIANGDLTGEWCNGHYVLPQDRPVKRIEVRWRKRREVFTIP